MFGNRHFDEYNLKSLKVLLTRRKAAQTAYDALIAEPQSYGITGSVSATNQRLADLRAEISALDAQIAACCNGGKGMSFNLPNYRRGLL